MRRGLQRLKRKKYIFAVEVEITEGIILREAELTQRIASLERQMTDCEPESRSGGQEVKKV